MLAKDYVSATKCSHLPQRCPRPCRQPCPRCRSTSYENHRLQFIEAEIFARHNFLFGSPLTTYLFHFECFFSFILGKKWKYYHKNAMIMAKFLHMISCCSRVGDLGRARDVNRLPQTSSRCKLKGPSQPHLYFCLHSRVWLLYFIRSKSKRRLNHCETTKAN